MCVCVCVFMCCVPAGWVLVFVCVLVYVCVCLSVSVLVSVPKSVSVPALNQTAFLEGFWVDLLPSVLFVCALVL